MFDDRSFARFIKSMIVTVLGCALLVTLFVVLVDPYRIHRLVEVAGFNTVKPGLDRFQPEIKIAGARAVRADVFLMGNSRMEIGLDPESKEFAGRRRSPYNLAVPGSGVATAYREFEALRAAGNPPSVVVLGVEFLDFLVDPNGAERQVTNKRGGLNSYQWKIETVFSIGALLDALKTLQIQHSSEAVTTTARGFNPLLEYAGYARDEGYNAIFRQRALDNAKGLARKPHGLTRQRTGTSSDWKELRALITSAAEERAEVHLVIYPYHAQLLAMFERAGLWPAFEQWKAMLANEVDRARRLYPGVTLTLQDFSGFSEIQCERIPAKGDYSSVTRWYWEAGHFKPVLGDMILERVLGAPRASVVGEFGIPLDLNNLDENRHRIARERGICFANYPGLFKDVGDLMGAQRAP